MTVYQTKQSYQCRHDAHANKCIVENCPSWNGLQPDDIESIFGKRSSSVLAARFVAEKGLPAYQALRRIAMYKNLIPRETIPVSLRSPE
jgi:hypothetical protein